MPNDLFSDIATLRAASEPSMQKSFEALRNPGQLLHIPMRDGFQSTVRLYHPKSQPPTKRSPLVVLLFGGGFVSGDNRQLAAFAIALVSIYGAVVALPDYRLAPEHPFPAAQNDVWDTLTHLTSNAESLKLDPSAGFILGGVSAGGNIAAALSQKWINEGITPKLTGMWLSIPLIFKSSEFVPEEYRKYYLAREQNKDALGINERALQWVNHYQKPNPGSPLYSPFNSPSLEGHRNVAKEGTRVYFQVAGGDPLRDDGLIYERVLREAGVDTKLDVYPGVSTSSYNWQSLLWGLSGH
jgi:acetyl esterase/lipase